ncbi:class I lanthipeptide [Chitinophaga solisilvae]|uniref:Uncharacterized protein n=1 Tax=Chitinophaga solisilvae TaxID=1233460 RepID=A0A3S1DQL4_9BACT|nr:class I lanthipeptide [Chitinophaga solisilvae]NSL90922.1 hypothetical protein [Chitinophaga solisilvae]
MKKRKLILSKKLLLKKDNIIVLNAQQQANLAGGLPLTYWSGCCIETDELTCPAGCVRTSRATC